MRTKLSMFVLGLVLALVLSACGPALSAQPRTLDVSGTGTVYLTPDIAYLYIGVHTEEPAIATAVSNNNTQTTALVDALKNAGVAEVDIQTSNFSVYKSYDKLTDQQTGTPYAVDNTVYVTVRDLTTLGSLLNTAVEAGANNINSITFDVADKTAAMTQARQKAMANASSLASELAQTAGVQLAEIQNVSYSDYSPNPYSYGMGGGGGAEAANASVPIQPGLTQITVTVSVTYSIK